MKKIIKPFLIILGFYSLFTGCDKQPADLGGFSVSVDKTDIIAGEPIIWTIQGNPEFLTFFSGIEGSSYSNYPLDKGLVLDPEIDKTVVRTYNSQDTIVATFVATSYGDCGDEVKIEIKNFTINIIDNRTDIKSVTLNTGSVIFPENYEGLVDKTARTVVIKIPAVKLTSNITTNIKTESPDAIIMLNGNKFKNDSKVNYTNPVVFEIIAPDGTRNTWTFSAEAL